MAKAKSTLRHWAFFFFAFAVIYATRAPTPSLGYLIFNKPQPPSPTSSNNNKQFININIALRLWALALAARRACASRVVRFFALLHFSSVKYMQGARVALRVPNSRFPPVSHLTPAGISARKSFRTPALSLSSPKVQAEEPIVLFLSPILLCRLDTTHTIITLFYSPFFFLILSLSSEMLRLRFPDMAKSSDQR